MFQISLFIQTYNQTMEFMAEVLGNPTDQADEVSFSETLFNTLKC